MADYRLLRTIRIPTERGHVEQRIYDNLSVDMLVQHYTRSYVRALKASRKPQMAPLRRALLLPLTQRRLPQVV